MTKNEIYKTIKKYSPNSYRWITEEFENSIDYDFTPRCEQKDFNNKNDYAQKLVSYLQETHKRDLDYYLEEQLPSLAENCTWAETVETLEEMNQEDK